MMSYVSSAPNPLCMQRRQQGFSLVEMAVVMVILGMILGGILMPLSTQRDVNNRKSTERQLQEIHDALIGFAVVNGRLPCPATPASSGLSAPNTATTNCSQEHGFVPGRTLGLSGSYNSVNLLTDAWANPVRYSLTSINSWVYANNITVTTAAGNYRVCRQSGCAASSILAENVVAVIYSLGKDGAQGTGSPDQLENTDNDIDFVSRIFSEGTNTEFDDISRWISPNVLALNLVRAGRLD